LYPKECNICSKFRVQYKTKKYEPYKITTIDAQRTIKAAARVKDEKLYAEIQHLDLIAKEFKVHMHCYQNFTRGYSEGSAISTSSSTSSSTSYDRGDFETVKEYIQNEVLLHGKAVAMKYLHQLYGLSVDDSRYRNKLKERIKTLFGDELLFLIPSIGKGEIVVAMNCLDGKSVSDDDVIVNAAKMIRNEISRKFKDKNKQSWPPKTSELISESMKPPEYVYLFLRELLKLNDKRGDLSVTNNRLVESFANDFVYGVTGGKILQQKHFLLGVGLHNLTGSRKIVDIIHKLGHCISYDLTCEIETAQAEIVLKESKENNILPLQPASPCDSVLTHYWVDNFDVNIDRTNGGGSVNTTPLVAYQEKDSHCRIDEKSCQKEIPNKKSRRLFIEDVNISARHVNKTPQPENISKPVPSSSEASLMSKYKFLLWLYNRKFNSSNQNVPTFKGWSMTLRTNKVPCVKTVETYLPPITSKVTEFSTIQKYLSYLKDLSKNVNMPYVNITLDVGAAVNAYKTIWTHKDEYKNIIIHLGCFHFLKENFQVSAGSQVF